jgi:hypothetical protein
MKFLFLAFLLTAGSCALAPMMSHRSAQTIGKDKNRIQAMPGISVLGVSYERGVSENWDLGASLEQQLGYVASVYSKYALVNKDQGVSWALSGGGFAGSSVANTSGAYGGSILSWKNGGFELFLFPRLNHVNWHGANLSSDESDQLFVDFINSASDITLNYVQVSIGMNFYSSGAFNMGFGASYFNFLDSEKISGSDAWLPEIMLGWNF